MERNPRKSGAQSTGVNRPDLVSRVFHIKLNELLDDIGKRHVLGKQKAKIHVIEFQKRGLPHAHILIILRQEDKPSTDDKIDKLVCAEIPDPVSHPKLHSMVTHHMIHGPCGTQNMNSPCMDGNNCTKDFPKDFSAETIASIGGYPRYRRRENGVTATVGQKSINNQWVVPYNPFLLLKYNCHINIEVCATIKSVKYLFKYVYKGHDCANVEIRENANQHDEVKSFLDARYISPPEAAWRLFGYRMHQQTHTVSRLQVHLPNEQMIVFQKDSIPSAVRNAAATDTTLTAWFKLNQIDSDARNLFYFEVPEHYIFENLAAQEDNTIKQKIWRKRRNRRGEKTIGRIYTVSFSETERYCLRMLLLHKKGVTSFEDLRTINGTIHDNFQQAAAALGLLDSDEIWEETLDDAVISGMPYQLRQLFALICIFACPMNIVSLWEKYKVSLMEDDFGHRHPEDCQHCMNLALRDIQETLAIHGKFCNDFGLPKPRPVGLGAPITNFNPLEQELLGLEMSRNLNAEQLAAFELICASIVDPTEKSKCYFIDGPGGSGKTYLYKTLISTLRGENKIVVSTASTGIAANLLPNGELITQYKLPVPLVENSVRLTSADARQIKASDLLIWDEWTMAPRHALSSIDRLLKEITTKDIPFGGKVLLLGGDFRQTLPVVLKGSRSAIVESSIKFSNYWDKFAKLTLVQNVRSVDPEYSEWLLKLGNGELLNSDNLPDDFVEIPLAMIADKSIVQEIFGEKLGTFEDVMNVPNRAILCPKNEDAHKINREVLDILEGEEASYLSVDSIEDGTEQVAVFYPTEFLNGLHPSPPHILRLKVGAVIMLLRNLNTKRGLCNGTRLIVTKLQVNLITAQVLTGSAAGHSVFIPRIQLAPINPEIPFVLRRRQFPVNLAFAVTINKSQGQTMDLGNLHDLTNRSTTTASLVSPPLPTTVSTSSAPPSTPSRLDDHILLLLVQELEQIPKFDTNSSQPSPLIFTSIAATLPGNGTGPDLAARYKSILAKNIVAARNMGSPPPARREQDPATYAIPNIDGPHAKDCRERRPCTPFSTCSAGGATSTIPEGTVSGPHPH
ncbi:uncharacterized protein LOC110856033 [Folsomia candida]|uniref:uncharacterized protein LOC110856033 n=1 Tax=Folsomia candida TaxID=158441 RepID=UPI000B907538|nr:uncharacterized protein LOC110856033 [Folsomia candida]